MARKPRPEERFNPTKRALFDALLNYFSGQQGYFSANTTFDEAGWDMRANDYSYSIIDGDYNLYELAGILEQALKKKRS